MIKAGFKVFSPVNQKSLRPESDNQAGAAMLEFALIISTIVIFVGGIIDYGWTVNRSIVALEGLQEGVRSASRLDLQNNTPTPATCATIKNHIQDVADSFLSSNGISGYTSPGDYTHTVSQIGNTCVIDTDLDVDFDCFFCMFGALSITHTASYPIHPGSNVNISNSCACP